MNRLTVRLSFFIMIHSACSLCSKVTVGQDEAIAAQKPILGGAYAMDEYLPHLQNKRVGLVINSASKINDVLLMDSLLKRGVNISGVFVPEHGFRAQADAGDIIADELDPVTGIPVWSLYGKNKKPGPKLMDQVDIIIFDLQDVGVRFYTYISTLHYVMEACAEHSKRLIVLDRPNPNGHYVDGPILDTAYRSFVGIHPIPVVYGMTIGELALMINGEKWLHTSLQADLIVVPCKNYTHKSVISLKDAPSPNLKTDRAILLYPSLCFFEGTIISLGRGTAKPFECYGHPQMKGKSYSFTPLPVLGAMQPLLKDSLCFGVDLSTLDVNALRMTQQINLGYLLDAMSYFPNLESFFKPASFFDKLSGSNRLRLNLLQGKTEAQIRSEWANDLKPFLNVRKKYLLYPD